MNWLMIFFQLHVVINSFFSLEHLETTAEFTIIHHKQPAGESALKLKIYGSSSSSHLMSFKLCYVYYFHLITYQCIGNETNSAHPIILVEDVDVLRELNLFPSHTESNGNVIDYSAIIYRHAISINDLIVPKADYPMFEILKDSDSGFEYLKEMILYVQALTDNYEFHISIERSPLANSRNYIHLCTCSLIFASISLSLWWHIQLFRYRKMINQFQVTLTIILYFKILIQILMHMYCMAVLSENNNINRVTIYQVLLSFSLAIHKAAMLMIFILVSRGWRIHSEQIGLNELKIIGLLCLSVYLILAIDPIIDIESDSFSVMRIRLRLSDLKNITFNFILALYVTIHSCRIISLLSVKLSYARTYAQQYSRALEIKIEMIKYIILAIIGYSVAYFLFFLWSNYLFSHTLEYISECINYLSLHIIDYALLFVLLIIFRAKSCPDTFNMEINTSKSTKAAFSVYSVLLNRSSQEFHHQIVPKHSMCTIVINPNNFHSHEIDYESLLIGYCSLK